MARARRRKKRSMLRKGCGKPLGFKALKFGTGIFEDVLCGQVSSDWDGDNVMILLCKKCRKK